MWKLTVLCGFELRAPDGKEFVTRSSAARELICILALSGPAGIARASLANHLFDDHQNPESSLNVLISRLRSALAPHGTLPLLQTTGHRLHLVNVEADVFRLLSAMGQVDPAPQSIESGLSVLDHSSVTEFVPGTYRSSLVPALRDDLCVRILATFASWAQSPQIERWRPQLLRAVTLIQTYLPSNGITVERLLLIFGALGLKELLMKTYDDYESFLENEFGERTPRNVARLVDDLVGALDEQHRQSNQFPNFNLPAIYGREAELRHLVSVAQLPGIHVVAGHSGIGKTALLQSFATSTALAGLKRSWIDLTYEDEEKAFVAALSQGPDVLFIDHYTGRNAAFVARLHHALGTAKLFVAGVSPARISATTILMVGPLAPHPTAALDPSLRLFLDRVERYGADPDAIGGEGAEIVQLSEGVPCVIDMLARLTATAGPKVSRQLLERWRATETADQVEQVWPSMMIATRASVSALSTEGRTALSLLARLDAPIATGVLLESGALAPDGLQELVASGLVVSRDDGGSIQTQGLFGGAIKACTGGAVTDAAFDAFVETIAACILRDTEPMLGGSEASRRTAQTLVNELARRNAPLGIKLLDEVRQLLTAGAPIVLKEPALLAYVASPDLDDRQFAIALLGYGAYLFSGARYGDMLAFLEGHAADARMLLMNDESLANLLSQRALALRCLGRFDEALELYLSALDRARNGAHNRTIAKISYNIAVLYAQTGIRSEEGVRHLDEAIALLSFTPNQAAKVELLHMRALLMNGAGASLAEVEDELRAALCHAARFGLTMQVAWIAQNLGMVYARHDHSARAVVCEASAVHLAVGLPEGLGKESLRLMRSSLGTLGSSLQELGHYHHGVTCRSLMDRVGVYETFKQSEELVQSLKSRTYHGTVSWDEFPVTVGEIRQLCREYLDQVTIDAPELSRFLMELDALSGGHLGKITAGV